MTIQVTFRGPCLYLNSNGVVNKVYVPDGERTLIADDGKEKAHPDGTPAVPHFAGLAIFEGAKNETLVHRQSLRGKQVTLRSHDGGPCRVGDHFEDLIPIDGVANAGKASPMTLIPEGTQDFSTRVAAVVALSGGTMIGDVESTAKFRVASPLAAFAVARQIPLSATWNAEGDSATIEISGQEPITLLPSQRAIIYNWDIPEPNAADLLKVPKVKQGTGEENGDVDFKWLYEPFTPPAKNYSGWLAETNEKLLRAPTTTFVEVQGPKVGPPSPGSTGCNSARADG